MTPSTQSLILLSGGVDSIACLEFYKGLGYRTTAMFIDYGHPTRNREQASAIAIATYYSSPLEIVICNGPKTEFAGEILGRNAFLLTTALLFSPAQCGIIAIGIHAGTSYYDCHTEFVTSISQIIDRYSDGRILVGVTFLNWSKHMIWNYSVDKNVPLGLTWSCEVGPTEPCGQCLSCRDLEVLNAGTK